MKLASIDDTAPEVQRLLVEGYRRMTPSQKLQRMVALSQGVQQLALARLRVKYPQADERELQLRLAALSLPAELMRSAFSWDPGAEGY